MLCCRYERQLFFTLSTSPKSVTAPYNSICRLSHTNYIYNSNIQLYLNLQPKFCCTQTLRRVIVLWSSNITIVQFLPTIFRHIFNLFFNKQSYMLAIYIASDIYGDDDIPPHFQVFYLFYFNPSVNTFATFDIIVIFQPIKIYIL